MRKHVAVDAYRNEITSDLLALSARRAREPWGEADYQQLK